MSKIHHSSNGHKRLCGLCQQPISKGERVNDHHPIYKSEGGTETVEVHEACHRRHHGAPGRDGLSDFQRWGRLSALDRHWAFTLKNVKDHPLYEQARGFYQMFYSH